jgi:hypothetical protein
MPIFVPYLYRESEKIVLSVFHLIDSVLLEHIKTR